MKKVILKEGRGEVRVKLGHMSKKDVFPWDMGVIGVRTNTFVFAFKNSAVSITEQK